METQVIVWCGGKEGAREAGGSNPKCTTTGHGCSNINLCYYRLINLLLGLLVTHLVSVPILDVTMVSPTGTQHMCSFISKKVLQ